MSSTFYTSNICLKCVEKKKLLGPHSNYICKITVCFYFMKETNENKFYFMIGFLWSLYTDTIFL